MHHPDPWIKTEGGCRKASFGFKNGAQIVKHRVRRTHRQTRGSCQRRDPGSEVLPVLREARYVASREGNWDFAPCRPILVSGTGLPKPESVDRLHTIDGCPVFRNELCGS